MKKFTILIVALLTVAFMNVHGASKKYESLISKRKSVMKTIADPKNTRSSFPKNAMSKMARHLPQLEREDAWNINTLDWDSTFRTHYEYDGNGNNTLKTIVDVNQGPYVQYVYVYNTNNELTEATIKDYDPQNSMWVNVIHQTYAYDSEGRRTEMIAQTWDTLASAWINSEREYAAFNSHGAQTEYGFELYSGHAWYLLEGIKLEYVYDSNDLLLQDMSIYYDQSVQQWDTIDRMFYTYTAMGSVEEARYQVYDSAGIWNNASKEIFTLSGANEVVTASLFLLYNKLTNDWDSTDRMIDIEWFEWKGNINTSEYKEFTIQQMGAAGFENVMRYTAERPNIFGSKIEVYEGYDQQGWIPVERFSNLYDNAGNFIEFKYEEYIGGAYHISSQNTVEISFDVINNVLELIHSEWNLFTQMLQKTARYRYSDFVTPGTGTGRPEMNSSVVKIYPNPSTSVSTISLAISARTSASIEAYNILGEKVAVIAKDQLLETGSNTFVFEAPAGVYIIRTQLNDKAYSSKLIIE